MREIAKRANEIEKELGINFDDVLNKLTQEFGEFNDAVQKFRGRYCRERTESTKDIESELGDFLFNLVSVCNQLGINPNDFPIFAKNTLDKFEKRKDDYFPKKSKITICGSIAFYDEMMKVKEGLEKLGHKVRIPPNEVMDESGKMIPVEKYYKLRKMAGEDAKWIWERKGQAINWHFEKVEWADALFVLNCDKRGIKGYVGSNTLMEMGLGFFKGKRIYLLNQVPDISSREEILGMDPIVINGDLRLVR